MVQGSSDFTAKVPVFREIAWRKSLCHVVHYSVHWLILGAEALKTFNVAPTIVVFILGVTAGAVVTQLSGTSAQPVTAIDQQAISGTPHALVARFDQMEVRLGELTVMLDRVDDRIGRIMRPVYENQLSSNAPDGSDIREDDTLSKSVMAAGQFEEIKNRLFNSLHDPATNFVTLMQSNEMRSLSREQQDEVMREVAARLDSGQLRKEQFLPGYRPKSGAK
ncbi:MAG TPA: hypothetical protein VGA00_01555 [Acidiferrobacterales bacterium]|jgi:hypothetical protein